MKINPLIRTANDHHHYVGTMIKQVSVADRRLEVLFVSFDPVTEVESGALCHDFFCYIFC
jgi:hypothetical protein